MRRWVQPPSLSDGVPHQAQRGSGARRRSGFTAGQWRGGEQGPWAPGPSCGQTFVPSEATTVGPLRGPPAGSGEGCGVRGRCGGLKGGGCGVRGGAGGSGTGCAGSGGGLGDGGCGVPARANTGSGGGCGVRRGCGVQGRIRVAGCGCTHPGRCRTRNQGRMRDPGEGSGSPE